MRILFMGTPDFAVRSLAALVDAGHEVCGVFTQPDRPKNRGMKLQPSPVKEYAVTHGIEVYQPTKLRDGTAMEQIRTLAPELIVVAAYGRFLPDDMLDYPPLGCINVHASLLPKYRGAAPINWAILNGEGETGVTIMHMASEMDTGDMISTAATPIGLDETAPELYDRLAQLGGALLVETITDIAAGRATRTPQNHAEATFAPMLTRALSDMDWTKSAQELHNQVRGLLPWPAAVTELGGTRCKILSTTPIPLPGGVPEGRGGSPGTILRADETGIYVTCAIGVLRIDELQADGSRRMNAGEYLRGRKIM